MAAQLLFRNMKVHRVLIGSSPMPMKRLAVVVAPRHVMNVLGANDRAEVFARRGNYPQTARVGHIQIARLIYLDAVGRGLQVFVGNVAVNPIAVPISTRRANASAMACRTGEAGCSNNAPNVQADSIKKPSQPQIFDLMFLNRIKHCSVHPLHA